MSISDSLLWQRIQAFNIDEAHIALPFSKRLASENSWPVEFALMVIEEYKKFVYLACISVKPVIPSDEVDQAWHTSDLHAKLLGSVLWQSAAKRLHHNPTKGGKQEADKFEDWYARTKTLYEQEFASLPPRDIWPPSNERFRRPLHMKRVDMSANWVLRKSLFSNFLNRSLVASFLALFLLSGATVIREQNTDAFVIGLIILIFAIVIVFSIYLLVTKRRGGSGDSGCGGCGCGG